MASILKVDTIQDQDGNNIINESSNTITIGASGDTITIPSGATFASVGIDDNATSTAITIDSNETSTLQCSAGDSNFALLAYHPTSTATRTIAKFQSNVGGTQEDKVVIQTSGNVGIGTSSPSVTLDVNGGTSNTVAQFNSTDSNCNIGIFDNSTTGIYLSAIGDDFTIKTASSERMRINSSGNVGIGTSSPSKILHVSSNDPVIRLTDTDTGAIHSLSGSSSVRNFDLIVDDGGSSGSPRFSVQIQNSGKFYILNSGNVGIGTTSPQEKLDIDGNIAISGNTLFEEVVSSAGMPSSAGNKSVNTDYDSTVSLTAGKWLILVNASLQVFQTSGNESGLYLLSLSLGSSAGADNYGLIQKAVLKWGNGSNSYGDNAGGHFPTLTLGSTTTLHTRWRVTEYGTASNYWVRGNLTRIRFIRIG
jgi:hypothetical protein